MAENSGGRYYSGSVSSLAAAVAGLLVSVLWMRAEPGFEPLLAVIGGLTIASALHKKASLTLLTDIFLSITIAIAFILGLLVLYVGEPSEADNHPPIIHSLSANRTTVGLAETVTVIVDATDTDGDPLSYHWSARRGNVPGGNPGPQIQYVAPTNTGAGIDVITVTVSDGKGGTAAETLSIAIESQN